MLGLLHTTLHMLCADDPAGCLLSNQIELAWTCSVGKSKKQCCPGLSTPFCIQRPMTDSSLPLKCVQPPIAVASFRRGIVLFLNNLYKIVLPDETLCYAQVPSRRCIGQTAWLAGWQPARQQACPAAPSSACLQPWAMPSRSGSGTSGVCPKMTSHQRMPLLLTKAADGPCALTPRWVGTQPHCLSSLGTVCLCRGALCTPRQHFASY